MSRTQNWSAPICGFREIHRLLSFARFQSLFGLDLSWVYSELAPMFARVDAPQILFLAAASILIVGIAYLF